MNQTKAQTERQTTRSNGRYSTISLCNLCKRPAGANYGSYEAGGSVVACVCGRCDRKLTKMPMADQVAICSHHKQ
jgi:hypothetical protein